MLNCKAHTSVINFVDLFFLWIAKHKFLSVIMLVAVVAASGYFLVQQNTQKINTEFYTVEKTDLQEVVSLTGTVKASEDAQLSFQKSGVVKDILVKVGDKVSKDQKLATLLNDDEYAKVLEANANLKSAQATLLDLQTGSQSQTIDIKKANVDKANSDITQAYKNIGDAIKNLSISGNTYVRDNFASYFNGDAVNGYKINIASCDSVTENNLNVARTDAEIALKRIEFISQNFNLADTNTQQKYIDETSNEQIPKITKYLDTFKNLLSESCLTTNNNYNADRITLSNSRNNWSTLATDISTKTNNLGNLKIALYQAQNDLQLSQGGQKDEKIKAQIAQVAAAQARLAQAQADLDKDTLNSPFSGVITNIDLKKGELVSPNGKTISLISDGNFQIESKVSEIDVAKLSVGASSTVTFDAYGPDALFDATISNISPAGIITDGVPTYKTIFDFTKTDERIRSGMTANINVVTALHPGVISIPAKFIQTVNNQKVVDVMDPNDSGDTIQKVIKTGATGGNGEVEILDGLNVGDIISIVKNF